MHEPHINKGIRTYIYSWYFYPPLSFPDFENGVYLCVACGFKAQFKIHKLSLSCNFTESDYGRANEKKAEAGTLSEVPAFSATSRRGTFSTGAGITIQRPVPYLSSTIATLPPSAPPPLQHPLRARDPYSSLPLFNQNLQDLVELEEAGEAVIWPSGLDRISATVAIKEALQNGNVGDPTHLLGVWA